MLLKYDRGLATIMGGGPFHLRSPWPVSSCLAPLSLLNYHHAPAPKGRSKHALRFALWSPTGLSQSVRWEERVVVSRGGLQRGYHSRAKRFNMSESACTRSVHRFSLRCTLAIISVTGRRCGRAAAGFSEGHLPIGCCVSLPPGVDALSGASTPRTVRQWRRRPRRPRWGSPACPQ